MFNVYSKKTALLISYFYIVINTVAGLITSSIIVKTLGVTDYGVYQIATSFSAILALLNFGTGTVMTRNIAASKVNKEFTEEENISTLIWMSISICAIMMVALVAMYSFFDVVYSNSLTQAQILQAKPMFAISSVNIIMVVFFQTIEGIVHGNNDFVFPKLFSIFHTIVYFLTVVFVFPLIKNALLLVVTNLIMQILGICFMLSLCKRWYILKQIFSIKKVKKIIFISSMSYVAAMLLQVFVNQSITQLPKTIIGIMLSPEAVALFSIAIYIYSMFSSVVSVPINIFLPKTVRNVVNKEKKDINWDFLVDPCRINSLLGGAILFGFFSLGKYFIILMYGVEQKKAWLLAMILLLPMYLNMIIAPCMNVLDALNKRLVRSVIIAITATVSLILTVLFVENYGLVFCTISIAFSLLIGNTIAMSIYYEKAIGIPILNIYISSVKGILPALIIPSIIVYFISDRLAVNWVNFIALGFFLVLLFLGCLILFGFNKQEKKYIGKFINKLIRR